MTNTRSLIRKPLSRHEVTHTHSYVLSRHVNQRWGRKKWDSWPCLLPCSQTVDLCLLYGRAVNNLTWYLGYREWPFFNTCEHVKAHSMLTYRKGVCPPKTSSEIPYIYYIARVEQPAENTAGEFIGDSVIVVSVALRNSKVSLMLRNRRYKTLVLIDLNLKMSHGSSQPTALVFSGSTDCNITPGAQDEG